MAPIVDEIAADRKALESIMDDLGFGGRQDQGPRRVDAREGGPPQAERADHRATRRSAGVVELEGLMTGITGKIGLWVALLQIAPDEPRLDAARLERLRERGESQRRTVEELRERAAREAFAG